MYQKSRGESESEATDKTIPVKAINFWQSIKWPGIPGAGLSLVAGRPNDFRSNVLYCETIFQYRGKFCIDGKYWMPETSGAILNWEY